MRVVYGISQWREKIVKPVVAIGVFDGLHHGHRLLISKTLERAKAIGGTPVVLTFNPHPVKILHPNHRFFLIASLAYRLRLIESQGVAVCLVVRFTRRFAAMEYLRFIEYYLCKKIHVAEVVVGQDFHFGRHRRGNVAALMKAGRRYGFQVHEIPVTKIHGHKKVSSTRIRKFIEQGEIHRAQELLERPVAIMGAVVKGDRRGHLLGYPTANLDAAVTGFAPRGVYCVCVHIDGKILAGMANVGSRPSFKRDQFPNIEVHIFDFHQNLYGRVILVEFLRKIRNERKFSSAAALMEQLHQDEVDARTWFSLSFDSCKNPKMLKQKIFSSELLSD